MISNQCFIIEEVYNLPNTEDLSCGFEAMNWWYQLGTLQEFNQFITTCTQEVREHLHNYSNTELFAYCEAKKLNMAFIHGDSKGTTWFCNANTKQ